MYFLCVLGGGLGRTTANLIVFLTFLFICTGLSNMNDYVLFYKLSLQTPNHKAEGIYLQKMKIVKMCRNVLLSDLK